MFLVAWVTFLLVSCASRPASVAGFWHSEEYSLMVKGWYWLTGVEHVAGSTLELREDGSYTNINCGNTSEGTWNVSGDSLLLHCISNRYTLDSLNGVWKPLHCGKKTDVFFIRGSILKQRIVSGDKVVVNNMQRAR